LRPQRPPLFPYTTLFRSIRFRFRRLRLPAFAALLLCAALAVLPLAATSAYSAEPKAPNIVLVMADDQGWGDMAYNGHPALKTPRSEEHTSELQSRENLVC